MNRTEVFTKVLEMPVRLFVAESNSGNGSYLVIRTARGYICTCDGWWFKKDKREQCSHIKDVLKQEEIDG